MQYLIWIRRQSPKLQWRLASFIGCAQENKSIGLSFWKVQLYYTLFSVLREVLQENLARSILQYFFYRVLLETHLAKKPARLILQHLYIPEDSLKQNLARNLARFFSTFHRMFSQKFQNLASFFSLYFFIHMNLLAVAWPVAKTWL